MVCEQDILDCFKRLAIPQDAELEVHCSLSSFGTVEGGAETVITALKKTCPHGSIFMPALRLSRELPLSEDDKKLGILTKIQILPVEREKSAMGIVADTFRKQSDVVTGNGIFGISGWGKNANKAVTDGLGHVIKNNGMALLFGVDIYKLTAMHYVEHLMPKEIGEIFVPNEEVNKIYPTGKWFIETGRPPVKAWYTIQKMAYEKGFIRDEKIGNCKVMYFKVSDVVGLYKAELERDPFKLYGMEKKTR